MLPPACLPRGSCGEEGGYGEGKGPGSGACRLAGAPCTSPQQRAAECLGKSRAHPCVSVLSLPEPVLGPVWNTTVLPLANTGRPHPCPADLGGEREAASRAPSVPGTHCQVRHLHACLQQKTEAKRTARRQGFSSDSSAAGNPGPDTEAVSPGCLLSACW